MPKHKIEPTHLRKFLIKLSLYLFLSVQDPGWDGRKKPSRSIVPLSKTSVNFKLCNSGLQLFALQRKKEQQGK
jgi:hypothetical protein